MIAARHRGRIYDKKTLHNICAKERSSPEILKSEAKDLIW